LLQSANDRVDDEISGKRIAEPPPLQINSRPSIPRARDVPPIQPHDGLADPQVRSVAGWFFKTAWQPEESVKWPRREDSLREQWERAEPVGNVLSAARPGIVVEKWCFRTNG
jgi:hypothetical protein